MWKLTWTSRIDVGKLEELGRTRTVYDTSRHIQILKSAKLSYDDRERERHCTATAPYGIRSALSPVFQNSIFLFNRISRYAARTWNELSISFRILQKRGRKKRREGMQARTEGVGKRRTWYHYRLSTLSVMREQWTREIPWRSHALSNPMYIQYRKSIHGTR